MLPGFFSGAANLLPYKSHQSTSSIFLMLETLLFELRVTAHAPKLCCFEATMFTLALNAVRIAMLQK